LVRFAAQKTGWGRVFEEFASTPAPTASPSESRAASPSTRSPFESSARIGTYCATIGGPIESRPIARRKALRTLRARDPRRTRTMCCRSSPGPPSCLNASAIAASASLGSRAWERSSASAESEDCDESEHGSCAAPCGEPAPELLLAAVLVVPDVFESLAADRPREVGRRLAREQSAACARHQPGAQRAEEPLGRGETASASPRDARSRQTAGTSGSGPTLGSEARRGNGGRGQHRRASAGAGRAAPGQRTPSFRSRPAVNDIPFEANGSSSIACR
jgi:hypothetical protein